MTDETLVGQTETSTDTAAAESTNESQSNEGDSLVGGSAVEGSENSNADATQAEKAETKEEAREIVYEDFKLPEGIALDEEFAGEFKNIAKELNLNQDQAQKLVDLQTKFTQTHAEKINADFKAQVNQWKEESITELGPHYKAELSVIAKARQTFGTPELSKLLNETGIGNHKEVVKFFLKIGKTISEDTFKGSGDGRKTEKSLAEKHYPNTKS